VSLLIPGELTLISQKEILDRHPTLHDQDRLLVQISLFSGVHPAYFKFPGVMDPRTRKIGILFTCLSENQVEMRDFKLTASNVLEHVAEAITGTSRL
jgi:hypothetical protein